VEAAILFPMPEPDRDTDLLERKTPRLRIDFGVDHEAIRGGTPGLALTFKAGLEGGDVAHHVGVAGLEKLEQQRPQTNRELDREKRPRGVKREAQQLAMPRIEKEQPAIERQQSVSIHQVRQRRSPTHNRDGTDPFGHRPSRRKSVGRSAGDCEQPEFADLHSVG